MFDDFRPTHTAKDPDGSWQWQAIKGLRVANEARIEYARILDAAIADYGDGNGRNISGIYREHFPEDIKRQLRQQLATLNLCNHNAAVCWRKAGRRMDTFRRLLEQARQLPDSRVSFY